MRTLGSAGAVGLFCFRGGVDCVTTPISIYELDRTSDLVVFPIVPYVFFFHKSYHFKSRGILVYNKFYPSQSKQNVTLKSKLNNYHNLSTRVKQSWRRHGSEWGGSTDNL